MRSHTAQFFTWQGLLQRCIVLGFELFRLGRSRNSRRVLVLGALSRHDLVDLVGAEQRDGRRQVDVVWIAADAFDFFVKF